MAAGQVVAQVQGPLHLPPQAAAFLLGLGSQSHHPVLLDRNRFLGGCDRELPLGQDQLAPVLAPAFDLHFEPTVAAEALQLQPVDLNGAGIGGFQENPLAGHLFHLAGQAVAVLHGQNVCRKTGGGTAGQEQPQEEKRGTNVVDQAHEALLRGWVRMRGLSPR